MSWRRKWAGLSVRPSRVRKGRQKEAPVVSVRQVSSNQDPSTAGNPGGHGLCPAHSKNLQMLTMQEKDSQKPQVTAGPWLLLTGRIPLQNCHKVKKDFSHSPSPFLDALVFPCRGKTKCCSSFSGPDTWICTGLPSCSIRLILYFYISLPCSQLPDFWCQCSRSQCPHQSCCGMTHTGCL